MISLAPPWNEQITMDFGDTYKCHLASSLNVAPKHAVTPVTTAFLDPDILCDKSSIQIR